jgi:hypothetical protein
LLFAAFMLSAVSIRCPKCGLYLFWYAISHQGGGKWLAWLIALRACPRCSYCREGQHEKVDL